MPTAALKHDLGHPSLGGKCTYMPCLGLQRGVRYNPQGCMGLYHLVR